MKQIWISLFLFILVISLSSCGSTEVSDGEDYGDLLDSPEGLTLTAEEHEAGWGVAECTLCHNLENIHLVNRTDIGIDIEAIHDDAIADGISGCAACHGANGVP